MPRRSTDQDRAIGARIRERRVALGMSMETLGEAVGLTYQQIQKYENGTNRVAAGRLAQIATALNCDVMTLISGSAPKAKAPGDSTRRAINGYLNRMGPETLHAVLTVVKALRTGEARS